MAEKVTVKGGGDFDGAQLDNAASEATLKRLADAFEKKFGNKSKIFEIQEKTVKNNITATETSTKKTEAFKDSVTKAGNSTNKFSKNVDDSAKTQSAYDNTLSRLKDNTKKLSDRFSEVGGLAIGGLFSGIAGAGKMLLGFFTDGLDSLRQTSQIGATFNNDITELRRAAAAAAMPLDMFTETISKNSQVLAMFGGTVTQGAKRFGDLSKEIRTGSVGEAFMGMGMTMGELNDYLADYLEIEMRSGRIKGRTDAELIQNTQNYILEVDKLAKVTGQSRKQASDALKQNQADARLSVLRRRLSGEQQKTFDQTLGTMRTGLKDAPEAFNSLANMMSGVVKPGDDLARALLGADRTLMPFMQAVGRGEISSEEFAERMQKLAPAIQDYTSRVGGSVVTFNESFAGLENASKSLAAFSQMNDRAAKAEQARRDTITTALGSFAQTFEKIKGDIMVALIDSKVFDRLKDGLGFIAKLFLDNAHRIGPAIANMIDTFDNFFNRFLDKVDADGIGAAIGDFLKGLLANIFGKGGSADQQAKQTQNREAISKSRSEEARIKQEIAKLQEDPNKIDQNAIKKIADLDKQLADLENKRKSLVAENNQIEDSVRGGLFSFDWSSLSTAFNAVTSALGPLGLALGGFVAIAVAIPATAAAKLLALGGAIGIAAGGFGYLLQGVASVIEQAAKALDMMPASLKKFEELDSERLKVIGPALAELTKPLMQAGFAGVLSSIGGDGLPKLANSIRDFESVNPEKIKEVGPALEILNRGLAALTGGGQGGVLQAFSGAISRFLTGDNGLSKFADGFKKFNEIDAGNITTLVSGLDNIKTKLGEDFGNQAKNVDTFATSIKNLRKDLEALKTTLDSLAKGSGAFGSGQSALSQVVTQINQVGGGAAGATNAMLEEQRKLNTLMIELKPVFEATRDNTKDTADGVSGRRSLTER